MVVRIVPRAFVDDGWLVGPGRHDFGDRVPQLVGLRANAAG